MIVVCTLKYFFCLLIGTDVYVNFLKYLYFLFFFPPSVCLNASMSYAKAQLSLWMSICGIKNVIEKDTKNVCRNYHTCMVI